MPLPETLTIRNGPLMARFSPHQGGRMTHLVHDALGDILVPMAEGAFDPFSWPKAGAYPLFPYHNRLVGAAFVHEGQAHRILPHPALGTDAMHGPSHRRAWAVLSHDSDTIELALTYQADTDWPFDFAAVQRFRLSPERLDIDLCLRNIGQRTMPGGFGWHPYFAVNANNTVHCDANVTWPLDEHAVPTGKPAVERNPEPPLPSNDFTIHLSDWKTATAVLDGGGRIAISADAALPHLVAHRTSTYVCLEPVSHVAGALRWAPAQQEAAGLVRLEPGQAISGKVSLAIGV